MTRFLSLALPVAGLLTCMVMFTQVRAEDTKKGGDFEKLHGMYEIVSGERNGSKITADRLKEVGVRIASNAITTVDKDKKEVYVATYEVDTSKKPWRIRMKATVVPKGGEKGTPAEGLISSEGETVKLIYALPGGKAPTEFKTGDKQQMFVLKKVKK